MQISGKRTMDKTSPVPPNGRALRQLTKEAARHDYGGILYVLPALIIVAALVIYPTVEIIRLSFVRTSGPVVNLTTQFVGLRNYAEVLTSRYFPTVLHNTVVWTVSSVSLQYLLGLISAVILNQPFRGRTLVRAIVMLPWAVPAIVVALTWRWMYNADFGLVNSLLDQVGMPALKATWLGQESTALGATVIANIWMIYPFAMLMLLAGLQAVPQELLDAAYIDGASPWQTFRHVTFPLLHSVSTVVVILMAIWSLNGFAVIYGMTSGGPGFATETLALTIYRLGFKEFRFDVAAAGAVILLAFMVIFAALYIRVLEKED